MNLEGVSILTYRGSKNNKLLLNIRLLMCRKNMFLAFKYSVLSKPTVRFYLLAIYEQIFEAHHYGPKS